MGKEEILIIKTGAAGDVVRTSALLNLFHHCSIHWICSNTNSVLLQVPGFKDLNVYTTENLPDSLFQTRFSLLLSLEEEEACAKLANRFSTDRLTGIYWDNGIQYTNDSAMLFNASIVSTLGKQAADRLKWENQQSYQHLLFSLINKPFQGNPYLITVPVNHTADSVKIGIEPSVGKRWPNKKWEGYASLQHTLETLGYNCYVFKHRERLLDYLNDIRQCAYVVSGDTLAMHIALAYNIPCMALFNCTSPTEIYDYGLLTKIVSPSLQEYFYKTTDNLPAQSAITVESVIDQLVPALEKAGIRPSNKG